MKRRAVHSEFAHVHDADAVSRATDALNRPVTRFDPPDVLAAVKAQAQARPARWTGFPRLTFAGAAMLAATACVTASLIAVRPAHAPAPTVNAASHAKQRVHVSQPKVHAVARLVEAPRPVVRDTPRLRVQHKPVAARRAPIRKTRPEKPEHDVIIRYVAEAPPAEDEPGVPCVAECRPEPAAQPAHLADTAVAVVRAVPGPDGAESIRPDAPVRVEAVALAPVAADPRFVPYSP